jgi:hypothetical protein
MTPLRVVMGVIIVAIVAVTLLPLLVLVDLAGGGTGWGLCQGGMSSCSTSYFDGPELLAMLVVVVFILLWLLRLTLHAHRIVERHREREAVDQGAEQSVGGGDRLGGG